MRFIEFLGSARAGKTTQINRLKRFLESQGKSVLLITDRVRGEQQETPVDDCLAYQIVFYSHVIEAYHKAKKEKIDFLIVDRGFVDSHIWSKVLLDLGEITEEQSKALDTVFEPFSTLVDASIYFRVPLELTFERQKHVETMDMDATFMNERWLSSLESAYDALDSQFPNKIFVDGKKTKEEQEKIIQEFITKEFLANH